MIVATALIVQTARVSRRSSSSSSGNEYYGMAVGFAVLGGTAAVGRVSGGCFSPAVGLLALVSDDHVSDLWVYILGPSIGGLIGLLGFRLVYYDEICSKEGAPPADKTKLEAKGEGYAALA